MPGSSSTGARQRRHSHLTGAVGNVVLHSTTREHMTHIERQIGINAPRAAVWSVVSDLEGAAAWNPNVVEAHCPESAFGLGARRTCRLKPSGVIDETVTDWKVGERMEMLIGQSGGVRSARMAIELHEEGAATSVIATTDYQPAFGPLGLVMDRLVLYRSMRQMMDRSLAGLKSHVEAISEREAGKPGGHHL